MGKVGKVEDAQSSSSLLCHRHLAFDSERLTKRSARLVGVKRKGGEELTAKDTTESASKDCTSEEHRATFVDLLTAIPPSQEKVEPCFQTVSFV